MHLLDQTATVIEWMTFKQTNKDQHKERELHCENWPKYMAVTPQGNPSNALFSVCGVFLWLLMVFASLFDHLHSFYITFLCTKQWQILWIVLSFHCRTLACLILLHQRFAYLSHWSKIIQCVSSFTAVCKPTANNK